MKTRVIYCKQINLNRCALCASSVHQLSRLSQRSLSVFVLAVSLSQTMRPSLHSVSLLESLLHCGFIWSLHANYCNQTQVFLILHLTHLLSWVFLPLQTSLNHAPLATYPHRPTQAGSLWDSSITPISSIASNSDWTTFFLCSGKRYGRLRTTMPGSVSIWCWIRLVRPSKGENTSANCNRATSVSWEGERWSPPGGPEWVMGFWCSLLARDLPRHLPPSPASPAPPRSIF